MSALGLPRVHPTHSLLGTLDVSWLMNREREREPANRCPSFPIKKNYNSLVSECLAKSEINHPTNNTRICRLYSLQSRNHDHDYHRRKVSVNKLNVRLRHMIRL
jgi:hypothetical protein